MLEVSVKMKMKTFLVWKPLSHLGLLSNDEMKGSSRVWRLHALRVSHRVIFLPDDEPVSFKDKPDEMFHCNCLVCHSHDEQANGEVSDQG